MEENNSIYDLGVRLYVYTLNLQTGKIDFHFIGYELDYEHLEKITKNDPEKICEICRKFGLEELIGLKAGCECDLLGDFEEVN
jgi:hypothetical protein